MRQPGIEPGAKAWEASMLPLHHWRVQIASVLVAQWIAHQTSDLGVAGSSPV